jgi:hypothetical protein
MALNILTERTSLPLCSFQGSRRRAGTVAGAYPAADSCGTAGETWVTPRIAETGSFKTEQCEAVHARPGRTEAGTRVVDIEILEDGLRRAGKPEGHVTRLAGVRAHGGNGRRTP